MDTKILSVYTCLGATYAASFCDTHKTYKCLDIDVRDFALEKRKPTKEELEKYKARVIKRFNERPTMLGPDYFVDKAAKEERYYENKNYPNNLVSYIKDQIGKVDFIFVPSHLKIRIALQDAKIDYITVYPAPNMLEGLAGRMLLAHYPIRSIELQKLEFNKNLSGIVFEPHGSKIIYLQYGEYLLNILDDIKDGDFEEDLDLY